MELKQLGEIIQLSFFLKMNKWAINPCNAEGAQQKVKFFKNPSVLFLEIPTSTLNAFPVAILFSFICTVMAQVCFKYLKILDGECRNFGNQ